MTKEIRDIGTDWIEVHEERNNDSLIELLLSIVHDEYKPVSTIERKQIMTMEKEYILALWEEFGDVPMNPKTECIEEYWHGFKKGTHRFDIWHWFEKTFGISVNDLLYE